MVLKYSEKFEMIMLGADPSTSGPVRWFTVPAGGSIEVDFPVKMNKLGDVEVVVEVRSNKGSKALTRNVHVKVR